MSLAIDTDRVSHVLLADAWHSVVEQSFTIDSYEYLEREHVVHGGGQSGICAAGFSFKAVDGVYCGPLSSVIAIKYAPK